MLDILLDKYPDAVLSAFGDTAELKDKLALLVAKGIKTATCSALEGYLNESELPIIGGFSIILDSKGEPVCVVRTHLLRVIRFNEITVEMARKEGEGDLSLSYWQQGHRDFFHRTGYFAEDMELIFEEFELIEVCKPN